MQQSPQDNMTRSKKKKLILLTRSLSKNNYKYKESNVSYWILMSHQLHGHLRAKNQMDSWGIEITLL